ncbi:MAG: Hsp20/alpha crystallin family protein [Candidatus Melainabacteria bacterium]
MRNTLFRVQPFTRFPLNLDRDFDLMRAQMDALMGSAPKPAERVHDMPLEVVESPTAYRVKAMIPGTGPERIQVEALENGVSIRVDLPTEDTLASEESLLLNEFPTGRLYRQLEFAQAVQGDAIEATYDLGVLQLTVPKRVSAQQKPIPIKVGRTVSTTPTAEDPAPSPE